MNAPFEITEEEISIPSEGLNLEGRLFYPSEARKVSQAVLLLPAHPFLGGDMTSNVMAALTSALAGHGMMALTFNYRGIGRSQTDKDLEGYQKEFWENSTSPEYEGKIFLDAIASFETLSRISGEARLSVVGYSFGALPALNLAVQRKERLRKICLISPPIVKWEIDGEFLEIGQSKLLVFSPGDFACPEDRLLPVYRKFSEPKKLLRLDACDHFYLGQEKILSQQVASFIADNA